MGARRKAPEPRERHMASRAARQARRRERILSFAPCEACEIDLATGEGERSCHYFACPYLPEELTVTCPTCQHNFFVNEGPGCGQRPKCEFARVEAPQRVAMLEEWLVRHGKDAVTVALPS